MTDVDIGEDWSKLDDLVALHLAPDADELRRRLILYPAAPGNPADAFEPWCLLHAAHKDEPDGAAATALLLLTDRRWRNATGRLIRHIEESGLVPPDHLDLLAQTFLAADHDVYWAVPAEWFDGPAIVIDFDQDSPGDETTSDEPHGELADDDDADDAPALVAREVRPPLRRWAAGRAIQVDPSCWGALVQRARHVDPRGGAAILHGLLDRIDLLAPEARDFVLRAAESWPHRKLRDVAMGLRRPPEPLAPPEAEVSGVSATAIPPIVQPSLF